MIRSQSFNTAIPVAESLESKGYIAVAKPNTLLSQLVSSTLPPIDFFDHNMSPEESFNILKDNIEGLTSGNFENPSDHNLHINKIVDQLSKSVTSHISFAKNVVKPAVIEYANIIQSYKDTNKTKDACEKFEVVVLNLPAICKEQSFLSSLDYYIDKSVIKPDLTFNLDNKSTEDLLKLISYGNDNIDKSILEWLSTLDNSFLQTVYTSLFTVNKTDGKPITFESIEQNNVFEKLNYALVIYLIARKLYDQVDESAKNINLNVYKNIATQYKDYSGASIAACLKKIAMFNKTKQLVIECLPSKYTAKVNGDIYRDWLTKGGSPEVIMGMIVEGDTTSSLTAIESKADTYKSRWNSYCSFYKANESNKQFDYFKEFLANSFKQQMGNPTDPTEVEYRTNNPKFYEVINTLLQRQLDNLKPKDLEDSFDLALCLIGKVRFYYTSAYNILSDINEASKVNPNIDVREAALLAVVNYLADYLADQISLTK